MIQHTAKVLRERHVHFIAARNEKPSWSTRAFLHTVCKIKHHGVISSGILVDEFSHKDPRGSTKQSVTASRDAYRSVYG